jgi:hypothetical protein
MIIMSHILKRRAVKMWRRLFFQCSVLHLGTAWGRPLQKPDHPSIRHYCVLVCKSFCRAQPSIWNKEMLCTTSKILGTLNRKVPWTLWRRQNYALPGNEKRPSTLYPDLYCLRYRDCCRIQDYVPAFFCIWRRIIWETSFRISRFIAEIWDQYVLCKAPCTQATNCGTTVLSSRCVQ